jgi:hypothetical protein
MQGQIGFYYRGKIYEEDTDGTEEFVPEKGASKNTPLVAINAYPAFIDTCGVNEHIGGLCVVKDHVTVIKARNALQQCCGGFISSELVTPATELIIIAGVASDQTTLLSCLNLVIGAFSALRNNQRGTDGSIHLALYDAQLRNDEIEAIAHLVESKLLWKISLHGCHAYCSEETASRLSKAKALHRVVLCMSVESISAFEGEAIHKLRPNTLESGGMIWDCPYPSGLESLRIDIRLHNVNTASDIENKMLHARKKITLNFLGDAQFTLASLIEGVHTRSTAADLTILTFGRPFDLSPYALNVIDLAKKQQKGKYKIGIWNTKKDGVKILKGEYPYSMYVKSTVRLTNHTNVALEIVNQTLGSSYLNPRESKLQNPWRSVSLSNELGLAMMKCAHASDRERACLPGLTQPRLEARAKETASQIVTSPYLYRDRQYEWVPPSPSAQLSFLPYAISVDVKCLPVNTRTQGGAVIERKRLYRMLIDCQVRELVFKRELVRCFVYEQLRTIKRKTGTVHSHKMISDNSISAVISDFAGFLIYDYSKKDARSKYQCAPFEDHYTTYEPHAAHQDVIAQTLNAINTLSFEELYTKYGDEDARIITVPRKLELRKYDELTRLASMRPDTILQYECGNQDHFANEMSALPPVADDEVNDNDNDNDNDNEDADVKISSKRQRIT